MDLFMSLSLVWMFLLISALNSEVRVNTVNTNELKGKLTINKFHKAKTWSSGIEISHKGDKIIKVIVPLQNKTSRSCNF